MCAEPMIVFCTTCKGRTQHLEQTLPKNLSDNADYKNCKFLILDYYSQDHLISYLRTNHTEEIDRGKVIVYSLMGDRSTPFRMAHAKNVAHRLGILEGADILVNLDADNYTEPRFASYVAEQFNRFGDNILLWGRWNQPGSNLPHIPKGCSGRIAVSVQSFLKAGGYDEKYATWGPDDKDFHYRVAALCVAPYEIDRKYLNALLHNDKMRFREYPHVAKSVIADYHSVQAVISRTGAIANYGQFGMGTVCRNFDFSRPWRLGGVPTRVFGIGMHKTATTSLHEAFRILGFDTAHWNSVRWAKAIWNEMITDGRSKTLERHYALSDLPITLLYDRLDRAYPGSKFILTTRDEASWIRSVEAHWSRANGFRYTWTKENAFPLVIHKALYGQEEFDRDVFLDRYRRHNQEVMEYFKDRPEDLLVLDMSRKDTGWLEVCRFLGMPIPDGEYPKKFVTTEAMYNDCGFGI
jgi:hypothetical protein